VSVTQALVHSYRTAKYLIEEQHLSLAVLIKQGEEIKPQCRAYLSAAGLPNQCNFA